MKPNVILLFGILSLAPDASAQDGSWVGQMNSGRNVFGPFHRPAIVRNEYGTDDRALLVFKDKTLEMYVPDVTEKNGYERLQELDRFGTYTTMLYMYDKKSEKTTTYVVSVSFPKKTIKVRDDFFSEPAVFQFDAVPYGTGNAIQNTTKIMQHEIDLLKHS